MIEIMERVCYSLIVQKYTLNPLRQALTHCSTGMFIAPAFTRAGLCFLGQKGR